VEIEMSDSLNRGPGVATTSAGTSLPAPVCFHCGSPLPATSPAVAHGYLPGARGPQPVFLHDGCSVPVAIEVLGAAPSPVPRREPRDEIEETRARAARRRFIREAGLTAAELAVLPLLVSGATNAEIAARLGYSPHTIKNRVAEILDKLEVRRRGELAVLAVERGLVDR
jgi:DNA-binding CsgD family transcriptional regulator